MPPDVVIAHANQFPQHGPEVSQLRADDGNRAGRDRRRDPSDEVWVRRETMAEPTIDERRAQPVERQKQQ